MSSTKLTSPPLVWIFGSSTKRGYGRSLNIGDKAVKLQLWDTAGQERFRGLANSYFKGAHAVLLVYDVHNKDSFEEVKNYWFKEVPSALRKLQQHMDNK